MGQFFEELKRRNVFRVAVAYLISFWVMIQVADIVFSAFQMPEWTITLIVVLLALGFIPVLIFSWVYELTPEGLKKDKDVVHDESITRQTTRKLDIAVIILLVIAIGLVGVQQILLPKSRSDVQPTVANGEKSIAVLPFLDLSQEGDQEYFADGIAEELLNVLAKVDGLKVASRTASFQYRNQDQNIKQIGKELRVNTLLEGSVRTSGNLVRITAQLTDVNDGYNLWSETYDRELNDIFVLQDEITSAIVKALRITLSHRSDSETVSLTATENVEAYKLYLRGRHLWRRRQADSIHRSIELFKEAVGLDPTFARAWSNLAAAYWILPGYDTSVDVDTYSLLAESAAEQALMLDSTLAESHAVIAQIKNSNFQWIDAEAAYRAAIEADPTDSTTHHWYALFLMETGRLNKALQQAEKAYELDPLNAAVAGAVGFAHHVLGHNDQARTSYQTSKELGWGARADAALGVLNLRLGNEMVGAELLRSSFIYYGVPIDWVDAFVDAYKNGEARPAASTAILALVDSGDVLPVQAFAFHALMGSERTFEIADMLLSASGPGFGAIWQLEAASLRRDPRMADLVRKFGLLPVWQKYGWPDACQPAGDSFICE
jgi:TolB-like protein